MDNPETLATLRKQATEWSQTHRELKRCATKIAPKTGGKPSGL